MSTGLSEHVLMDMVHHFQTGHICHFLGTGHAIETEHTEKLVELLIKPLSFSYPVIQVKTSLLLPHNCHSGVC